jgi:hypothetical protein
MRDTAAPRPPQGTNFGELKPLVTLWQNVRASQKRRELKLSELAHSRAVWQAESGSLLMLRFTEGEPKTFAPVSVSRRALQR